MRNLITVIEQMQDLIPTYELEFHSSLESRKQSAMYAAPETMQLWWGQVARTMAEHMGKELPTSGWELAVYKIWMDE